jgi:hypothetical protein
MAHGRLWKLTTSVFAWPADSEHGAFEARNGTEGGVAWSRLLEPSGDGLPFELGSFVVESAPDQTKAQEPDSAAKTAANAFECGYVCDESFDTKRPGWQM